LRKNVTQTFFFFFFFFFFFLLLLLLFLLILFNEPQLASTNAETRVP
jgi:hypothetical protein